MKPTNGGFGQALRHLRIDRGWSQGFLGAKIRRDAVRISRLERGAQPRDYEIERLATVFPELQAVLNAASGPAPTETEVAS